MSETSRICTRCQGGDHSLYLQLEHEGDDCACTVCNERAVLYSQVAVGLPV